MYKVIKMYKIYLDSSNSELMIQLVNSVQAFLLKSDKCIVYKRRENETRENVLLQIDRLELDAYIMIQDKASSKGPEVLVEEMNKISNGLAKEVYKEVNNVYNIQDIDKGIVYKSGVIEKEFREIPAIILNIICLSETSDINWLKNNMESIAEAISTGILRSFTLKQC